ncbi:MAG TPA: RsbRD N-terminal domain-containing protein, partial [Stellaceae bacterium]|nr:RsbRD N-terminal domain-containing protein [Stellaceae bacterium]
MHSTEAPLHLWNGSAARLDRGGGIIDISPRMPNHCFAQLIEIFKSGQNMARSEDHNMPALIARHEQDLLKSWLDLQRLALGASVGQVDGNTGIEESRQFLGRLQTAMRSGRYDDISAPEWAPVREVLDDVSRARSTRGFSPSETATFVFSLKQPL